MHISPPSGKDSLLDQDPLLSQGLPEGGVGMWTPSEKTLEGHRGGSSAMN